MKLVHYSAKPVKLVRSVPPAERGSRDGITVGDKSVGDKPRGFWVSDDDCPDNWRKWCLSETFGLERLRHRQEVILSPAAKILYLHGAADIDAFHAEHGAEIYPNSRQAWIDWRPIVRAYQGIVITPYVWSRRLDGNASWYYGWDCACGVIWDARAVSRLEVLPPVENASAEEAA